MIEPSKQAMRMLHREHVTVIGLLGRLSQLLSRHNAATPPAADDSTASGLLAELSGALINEIERHFQFEEEKLFPLLDENGDQDLSDLLREDHAVLVPVIRAVAEAIGQSRAGGFSSDAWAAFHPLAAELADRLTDHAEKEEMSLVPLLDDLLEDDEDADLAAAYAA
jgi:hemerythrin-like domain-containing protein